MANNAEDHMEKPALLLTRPRASAERFLALLDQRVLADVNVVISPLVEIVPTDVAVDLTGAAGVIFTSAHALPLAPSGEGRRAYCVGERTARAAVALSWDVALTGETADALVAQMAGVEGPLVHLAGQHRRGEVADRLMRMGIPTQVVCIYDQPAQKLTDAAQDLLRNAPLIIVPLFSPRTAQLFADQMKSGAIVHIIAMSAAVGANVSAILPNRLEIARAPTGDAMRHSVECAIGRASLP